jgi:hypothetical protein
LDRDCWRHGPHKYYQCEFALTTALHLGTGE